MGLRHAANNDVVFASPVLAIVAEPNRAQPPRLGTERCRELLARASGGSLALSQGALPLVMPVSCLLEQGSLFVRAAFSFLGKVPAKPGIVAFATGGLNLDGSGRWEVMVQGSAEVLHDGGPDALPPLPMVDGAGTSVLRVKVELLTGWQYGTATVYEKETVDAR